MSKVYLGMYKAKGNWVDKVNWQTFEDYERIVVKASTSKDGAYKDNISSK